MGAKAVVRQRERTCANCAHIEGQCGTAQQPLHKRCSLVARECHSDSAVGAGAHVAAGLDVDCVGIRRCRAALPPGLAGAAVRAHLKVDACCNARSLLHSFLGLAALAGPAVARAALVGKHLKGGTTGQCMARQSTSPASG